MKDDRLYAKFDIDTPDHPKMVALSDEAFRCWFNAVCWCRKHKTDGLLPRRYAERIAPASVLHELCTNDDANPSFIERPEGWYVHDFDKHQDTKADIEARREQARAAAQERWKRPAKRSAKRRASAQHAERNAETETETEVLVGGYLGGGGYVSNAPATQNGAPAPPPPCPKHKHWDHAENCRACAALRHWHEGHEQREAEHRQHAAQARRAAIDACHLCDANGMREARGGVIRCTHEPIEVPW